MIKRVFSSLVIVVVGLFLMSSIHIKALGPLLEVVDGASIRTEGEQGLRFYAKLDESVKGNAHGFYVAFGKVSLEQLEEVLDDDPMMLNGKVVHKIYVNGVNLENEFSVVLTGIPGIGYMDRITVIPFVEIGEEETFVDTVDRSIGEVAIMAANAGDNTGIDVINYIKDNVKRTNMNINGELELVSGVFETSPFMLKEHFIKDWNEKFETNLVDLNPVAFFNSAKSGLTDNIEENKDLKDGNLYKFFNDPYYGDRWGWLLTLVAFQDFYLNDHVRQRGAIVGNGTLQDYVLYHGHHLAYSIANFFNVDNQKGDYTAVDFTQTFKYATVKTNNNKIYIDPKHYDFFNIGEEITLDEAPEVFGHVMSQVKIGDTTYNLGDSFVIPEEDVSLEFFYEVANYEVTFYFEDEIINDLTLTYTYLDEVVLPEMDVRGIIFDGWYATPNLSKWDPREIIPLGSTGDKKFYADAFYSDYRRVETTFVLNGGNVSDYGDYIDDLNPVEIKQFDYADVGDSLYGGNVVVGYLRPSVNYYVMGFKKTNAEGIYELEANALGLYSRHDLLISHSQSIGGFDGPAMRTFYIGLNGRPIYAYIPELPENFPSFSRNLSIYFLEYDDFYGNLKVNLIDPGVMPYEVIKTGYTFEGWYADEELTDGPYYNYPGFDWDHSKTQTYYAKWEEIIPEVTFDVGYLGGVNPDEQVRVYGQLAIEPNTPERAGYVFRGWFNGEIEYDFDEPLTGSIHLVGRWILEDEVEYVAYINGNPYFTLEKAMKEANFNDVIEFENGVYDKEIYIEKSGLIFTSRSGGTAVITNKITVGYAVTKVTFMELEFTEDASIYTPYEMGDVYFYDNYVHNLNLVPTPFESGLNKDVNAFLRLVIDKSRYYQNMKTNNHLGNITIDGNIFENIDADIISMARTSKDTVINITNNTFHNFISSAIRFDGGYNNGTYNITNNVFENDVKNTNINVILFRTYGPEAGEYQIINILDNEFINVGSDLIAYNTVYYYPGSGVIAFNESYTQLTTININDNLFKGTTNAIYVRNQIINENLIANFTNNIFEDNDGHYLHQRYKLSDGFGEVDFTNNIFKDELGELIEDANYISGKIINNITHDYYLED